MRMLQSACLIGRRTYGRKNGKERTVKYMLRAMDSAVSGLRAHQQKLDVIGHNIANVNTVGYKSQSYTFKDTMYQSSTSSTRGTDTSGGVNAAQYGYGSLMGTISVDMAASTPTYVGGFAASIDGEGFFATSAEKKGLNSAISGANSDQIKSAEFDYTRVGQFKTDSNGYIVDGNGNFIYGFRMNANGTRETDLKPLRVPSYVDATSGNPTINDTTGGLPDHTSATGCALEAKNAKINKVGDIEVTVKNSSGDSVTVVIGTAAIVTFQNQEGLTKDGSNYYKDSESSNTGVCSAGIPGDNRATLMPGYLEASNVDMAVEFSEMIMAERGFQANSKIITVSDEILSDLINMKR